MAGIFRWTAVLVTALGLLHPAAAARGDAFRDCQIIARTLSLLVPRPPATIMLAVVHAPWIAASAHQADDIVAALSSGLSVGGYSMVPVLVSVDALDALAGATAVFVTEGLEGYRESIRDMMRGRGVATISTDFGCVRDNACVLGLRTDPTTEILLSRRALEQAGVTFESAFRLLVGEI